MLSLSLLAWMALLVAVFSFWWQSDRVKNHALTQVAALCRRQNLQLLDQTLVLKGLWPVRDETGALGLRRRYSFEFTSTGETRYQGRVLLLGGRLLSLEPASLQLRFLQTASEIAAENNSTTLFPLPMDLFGPIRKMFEERKALTEDEKEEIKALEARARKAADEATGLSMPSRISEPSAQSGLLAEGPLDAALETDQAEALPIDRDGDE